MSWQNRARRACHDEVAVFGKPESEARPWESAKDDKIKSINRPIDALVYELYGLSGEEIRIVEGK